MIRLGDSDALINEINSDIDIISRSGGFKTNSTIYSYNSSPRIVEAWRKSHAVKKLIFHPFILSTLKNLFDDEPRPFSTINFLRSTEQPFHSDAVHFPTQPAHRLVATWVALEDIDLRSGPLQVIPGSHKIKDFSYSQLGLPAASSISDVKSLYSNYEDWVRQTIRSLNLYSVIPRLVKGDCLIWDSNLLHGSPECLDNTISRRSQVTHYHFGSNTQFYNLAFSDPENARMVPRRVEFISASDSLD